MWLRTQQPASLFVTHLREVRYTSFDQATLKRFDRGVQDDQSDCSVHRAITSMDTVHGCLYKTFEKGVSELWADNIELEAANLLNVVPESWAPCGSVSNVFFCHIYVYIVAGGFLPLVKSCEILRSCHPGQRSEPPTQERFKTQSTGSQTMGFEHEGLPACGSFLRAHERFLEIFTSYLPWDLGNGKTRICSFE